MDGEQGREKGSHGDALHVGAFDPDREGLHVISVHEDPAVASLEYHDGDLLQELLDQTKITKYNEKTGTAGVIQSFEDVVSSNGTKATPTLQADILGDWRKEVLLPTIDSSELRIFSTTIPTEYSL